MKYLYEGVIVPTALVQVSIRAEAWGMRCDEGIKVHEFLSSRDETFEKFGWSVMNG